MRRAFVLLATILCLSTAAPSRADYAVKDARESAPKHMNISWVSSRVFKASYDGERRTLIKLRMHFYNDVHWRHLASPQVQFNLDTANRHRPDYSVVVFYLEPKGGAKEELQCWIHRYGTGKLILRSKDMKTFDTERRYATCTFPMAGIPQLKPSRVIRWNAWADYGRLQPHEDRAPDNWRALFPHL